MAEKVQISGQECARITATRSLHILSFGTFGSFDTSHMFKFSLQVCWIPRPRKSKPKLELAYNCHIGFSEKEPIDSQTA
jgi:hypothetical protein